MRHPQNKEPEVDEDGELTEIEELASDSLDIMFRAVALVKVSIVPPELLKEADIVLAAFKRYMGYA